MSTRFSLTNPPTMASLRSAAEPPFWSAGRALTIASVGTQIRLLCIADRRPILPNSASCLSASLCTDRNVDLRLTADLRSLVKPGDSPGYALIGNPADYELAVAYEQVEVDDYRTPRSVLLAIESPGDLGTPRGRVVVRIKAHAHDRDVDDSAP
jgi:hypothetical protein